MDVLFEKNCSEIKKKFAALSSERKYQEIIEMGRLLSPLPKEFKIPEKIVPGCQSTLYLHMLESDGKCFFQADADALISKGLAALLIAVYSGLPAESILKCPPIFLQEIGIGASLSPNRSNGLAQIHLRMKQEALKTFL